MIDSAVQRFVRTNGVDLHVTEAGQGKPVILCHGFPDLSYSWRHQIPVLADAGYHVLAPNGRGYGHSSRPEAITDYDIAHLNDDLLGLLDDIGEERAVFVGHDWGAMSVWNLAMRVPERVAGVVGMSVPFVRRSKTPPIRRLEELFGDMFFYMLWFQEPGMAEPDLEADVATTMRRFLAGAKLDPKADMSRMLANDGRGMIERMPEPTELPPWLSQDDLDHYIAEFTHSGFRGPLNWYRNLDRNWELTAEYGRGRIEVPSMFIGGSADPVLFMTPPSVMDGLVTDLRGTVIIDGAGHWVQQEAPDAVNAALLEFLAGLN